MRNKRAVSLALIGVAIALAAVGAGLIPNNVRTHNYWPAILVYVAAGALLLISVAIRRGEAGGGGA